MFLQSSLEQVSLDTRVEKPVLKERNKNGHNGSKTPQKRINQLNLNAVDSASEGKFLYVKFSAYKLLHIFDKYNLNTFKLINGL